MMTREELEGLGSSDEELATEYEKFFGARPNLEGDDDDSRQELRRRVWREVQLLRAGAYDHPGPGPAASSNAIDFPEQHAASAKR